MTVIALKSLACDGVDSCEDYTCMELRQVGKMLLVLNPWQSPSSGRAMCLWEVLVVEDFITMTWEAHYLVLSAVVVAGKQVAAHCALVGVTPPECARCT